jgi:hypothetical protein
MLAPQRLWHRRGRGAGEEGTRGGGQGRSGEGRGGEKIAQEGRGRGGGDTRKDAWGQRQVRREGTNKGCMRAAAEEAEGDTFKAAGGQREDRREGGLSSLVTTTACE